jgi:hypothetical protein
MPVADHLSACWPALCQSMDHHDLNQGQATVLMAQFTKTGDELNHTRDMINSVSIDASIHDQTIDIITLTNVLRCRSYTSLSWLRME